MEITITLTDAQAKALAYVAVDPELWARNAVESRCISAMDEIFQIEVARMLADPNITEIPADREAVVLASNLLSAAERNESALELPAV
jgi:hypothetical protein